MQCRLTVLVVDYQRFTEKGLRQLFRGFARIQVDPMGGYREVADLFRGGLPTGLRCRTVCGFSAYILLAGADLCADWGLVFAGAQVPVGFTTGYSLLAWKDASTTLGDGD